MGGDANAPKIKGGDKKEDDPTFSADEDGGTRPKKRGGAREPSWIDLPVAKNIRGKAAQKTASGNLQEEKEEGIIFVRDMN